MIRSLRILCAAVAVSWLALWSVPAHAGPWVPGVGEGYVKASGSYFDATSVYDRDGQEMDPNYTYSHYAMRLYADVGVAPHLGVSASLPFLVSTNTRMTDSGEAEYTKRGLGDLDLSLQSGTTFGTVAFSGVAKVRVPLYDEVISADSPTPTAFTEETLDRIRYLPALGDGSYDVTLLAQVGVSLHPLPGWVTASLGPKVRFQGFGDGIEYALSGGAFVLPDRLALQARLGGVQRFSGGHERPTKSYVQFSGGPLVRVYGPLSLEATASYIPTGAFVSKGWSAAAGLSYDGWIFPNPFGSKK